MLKNKEQFGHAGLEVLGITVHNTGNKYSARENYDWMTGTIYSTGCHYFVDENEVIEALPLDWCCYHTGKGDDWACQHTIAIEICRSQSDDQTYDAAEKRAVKLIKKLMKQYKLTADDVYFHNDFNRRAYCPHRILSREKKAAWKERNKL